MNLRRRCHAWFLILLPLALAGCSTTMGSRFGGTPQAKSIAVVGDRPVSVASGEPGGQVVAEADPEPKPNPKARITGRVIDDQGEPVANVTVRLADGASKGGKDIRGVTDKTGTFTLNGLRPGSTYSLIAEAEDDQGPLTGRATAKTSATGVEISLLSDEAQAKAASRKVARPSRARAVSSLEEPTESAVNREDVGSPADSAETLDPGPQPTGSDASRPRLIAPQSSTGWQNSSTKTVTRKIRPKTDDDDAVATSIDDPPRRSRVVPARSSGTDEEEEPNPLPPALAPGEDEEAPPRKPTSARLKPAKKPVARPQVKEPESGEMSLAPETSAIEKAGPQPLPEVGKMETTLAAAESAGPAESSGAPTGPPEMPPIVEPPSGPVLASGPPDLPPLTTAPMPSVPTTNPASQPVFASPEPTPVAATPVAAKPAEYDPFAIVGSARVDRPKAPVVVPPAEPPAPESAAVVDASDLAAPVPAGPKMKWSDLTAKDSKAVTKVEPTPTRNTIAASFIKRFRPSPAAAPNPVPKVDAAAASCSYDARLRTIKDFQLPDLEGKPVRFRDLDADFVLLDFWGTWCPPCLESIPHLIELQKKYGPNRLQVVGIACEEAPPAQRRAKVEEVARRFGINYPTLLSTMDGKPCPVQQALSIQAMPTTILLDRQGQVIWRSTGATPANEARLDRVLASQMSWSETPRR